jgi:cell wall-associated NlpC family hydrolase
MQITAIENYSFAHNKRNTNARRFVSTIVTVLFLFLFGSLSANAANEAGGVVKSTDVNVRAGADTDSTVLSSLKKGDNVVIVKWANDSWYEVIIAGGTRGFVLAKYINPLDSVTFAVGTGELEAEDVSFRAGHSTDSERIALLKLGTQFEVTGTWAEWYSVKYNGKEGYIHSDYVRILKTAAAEAAESTATKTSAVVKELTASYTNSASAVSYSSNANIAGVQELAMSLLGTKYVYAGASTKGFDCSGFTYYLAKSVSVDLPHGATGQYKYGTKIAKSDLLPGDFVFFSSLETKGIAHVGMYLGDGVFIHSSSAAKKVKLNNLSDQYYDQHWYGARRIL